MSIATTDYEDLRRYFLGRLRKKAALRLETRLFSEEEHLAEENPEESLFALAEVAKTDLLVEYFRRQLSARDRRDCRKLLASLHASPAGRDQIEFARSLAAVTIPDPVPVPAPLPFPPRPSAPAARRSLVAVAAAALVALVLLVPGKSPAPVPFHVPVASITRGGDVVPQLKVPARTPVKLELDLPPGEPFALYTVTIQREGHGTVGRPHRLAAPHPGVPLVIDLSAGDLPDGIYEVEVRGIRRDGGTEAVGFPGFRIVRR